MQNGKIMKNKRVVFCGHQWNRILGTMLVLFVGGYFLLSCETKEVTPQKSVPAVQTVKTFVEAEFSLELKGVVSSDGYDENTTRGFIYSLTQQIPELGQSEVQSIEVGKGIGTYSVKVENLQRNSFYYVRAYAQNAKGTAYGDVLRLRTTTGGFATLGAFTVSPVLTDGKQLSFSAEITGKGSTEVTERGVCWDTKAEPIVTSGKFLAVGSGTGAFDSFITGLNSNTFYFVRPYAKNQSGIAYGTEIRVSTVGLGISEFQSASSDISGISMRSAVLSNGGLDIIEKGIVWGQMSTPTLANGTVVNLTDSGSIFRYTIPAAQLEVGKSYSFRVYVTNSLGTGYSEIRKITYYPLGGEFKGGYIIFVSNENVPKVTVAAKADLPDTAAWGCTGDSIGTGSSVAGGLTNTNSIINRCSESNIAARKCRAYSVDGNNSWDLPTTGDMEQMFKVLDPIGKFDLDPSSRYWTSVQASESRALSYKKEGTNWVSSADKKYLTYKIRPVKTY